jgi:DNA-binding Xre family transcriptional regulator
MPRVNARALQTVMLRRNYLFKHQLANLVGISYDRLTAILADGETEVEDEIVARLCAGLDCEPAEILEPE